MTEEKPKGNIILRVIKYSLMGFIIYLGYKLYTA